MRRLIPPCRMYRSSPSPSRHPIAGSPGYGVQEAKSSVNHSLINVLAVRGYGEAEFWLSGGKVILIFMLFAFTFVTMCGGNPKHDAYGFRYWKTPGAFAEHHSKGDLGRFEGFLAALWSASFTVVGPEYIAMVAAEAKRPRTYIKTAFKTVYWRFAIFFIIGALCVGIVIPYNDPTLVDIQEGNSDGSGTAAASPYVIAMYAFTRPPGPDRSFPCLPLC